MYYLQSRYYDAELGRFINGDEAIFASLNDNVYGKNLFAYCNNSPINNSDETGYEAFTIAAVVAIIKAALPYIIGILAIAAFTKYISTPEGQRAWNDFCVAVAGGATWLGEAIVTGINKTWKWTRNLYKDVVAAITTNIAIAKAESKVVSKTKSIRKNWNRFYEIWFDDIGAPVLGIPINRDKAVTRARRGLNSITYFSSDALYVANRAGNSRAVWHQKHGGDGYFNHYHINGHRNSAHIYYIVAG